MILTRKPLSVLAGFLFVFQLAWSGADASEQLVTSDFKAAAAKAVELSEKYGTQNVLLVFDIDNTLLAMNQDLGSDQWFGWQSELLDQNPLPPQAAAPDFPGLLRVQAILYSISGMRPTQPDLPDIVRHLQTKKFRTLLLTSRGFDVRDVTRRELVANGFDFTRSAMRPARGYPGPFKPYFVECIERSGLSREEAEAFLGKQKGDGPVELAPPRPVSYSEGIYMTAGQHKGAMLRMLLARSGNSYRSIVFVDDNQRNVDRVFAAFKDTETEIITYRFSREDKQVKRFLNGDKGPVTKQWNLIKAMIENLFKTPRIPQQMPAKRAA